MLERLKRSRVTAEVTPPFGSHSYRLHASSTAEILDQKITITNWGDQRVTIQLRRNNDPDLSSLNGLFESILSPDMSDEAKAIAIFNLVVTQQYHYPPSAETDDLRDPLRFLNVYGYGLCADFARTMAALARAAGLEGRIWFLNGHVVAEIGWAGQWHMFDPDHRVYYRMRDGKIASVAEIAANPELIRLGSVDRAGFPVKFMAAIYESRHDNQAYDEEYLLTPELRPILDPGDQLTFDFGDPERFGTECEAEAPPPLVGTGSLRRFLSSSISDNRQLLSVDFQWPYRLRRGELIIRVNDAASNVQVEIGPDGHRWVPNPFRRRPGALVIPLDFSCRGTFYSFKLRVRSDARIEDAELFVFFQFAPKSTAVLQSGVNHLVVKLQPAADQVADRVPEISVIHEWSEGDSCRRSRPVRPASDFVSGDH